MFILNLKFFIWGNPYENKNVLIKMNFAQIPCTNIGMKMEETKPINITILNFDTISIVSKYLNVEDVVSLSSTCKYLRNGVDDLLRGKPITIGYKEIISEETMEKIKSLKLEITANLSCNLSIRNVSDVSMLGNVHTLNLTGCRKVTDVSMLGNTKLVL